MTIVYNGDLYNYRELRAEAHIFPMMSRTGIRPLRGRLTGITAAFPSIESARPACCAARDQHFLAV